MGWDSMLRPGTQLLAFSLAKFVPRRQANQKVLTTVSPLKTESEGLIRRFEVAEFSSGDALRCHTNFYPRPSPVRTERPSDSMSSGVGGSASMVCRMARAVRAAPVTNSSSMR